MTKHRGMRARVRRNRKPDGDHVEADKVSMKSYKSREAQRQKDELALRGTDRASRSRTGSYSGSPWRH